MVYPQQLLTHLGYTIRVQIHELQNFVLKGKGSQSSQAVFVVQCGDFRFKTLPRALDKTTWDDAIFDFHAHILPARISITLCEKQNLFGTNFGSLKIVSEISLQLTDQHTSASRDIYPLRTSTDAEHGRVTVSWAVSHNVSISELADAPLTDQPCAPESKSTPFSIFAGTWNLGNCRPPAMNMKNGLGFLDAAFACDIVAVGVQESMYTTEALRDALKDGPDSPSLPSSWSLVEIVTKMRAEGGVGHKFKLVDKKKRRCVVAFSMHCLYIINI
jgi:hypothetical protein